MRLLFFGILCAFCCMSCSSDEIKSYSVGSDFIENDIQVRVIDTFSIKTGTFKLDSLVTSSTSRILLGSLSDENLGHLTAKSFLQLTTSTFSIDSDAVYDSIGMILNYDTYYYGDTTKIQTYKLHRIIETVKPEEGDDFYNTSTLDYDSASLGELTFTPRPNRTTDSLYIPMNNELGEDIFNKIMDNDINNSDDFLQYFKGITIIPDTTLNSHILGFNISSTKGADNNSSMRLYYTIHDDDDEDNSYYVDFVISSIAKQFNAIDTDLSTTIVDEFENGEEIKLSEDTNNLIFTQAGIGISSRIEIPSIKKLSNISDTGSVLSAELTFTPLKGSYDESKPLEESLLVYIVDHKNRIIKELTDIDGNVSSAILNKNSDEFDENTYYSIDLSGYVEEILYSDYDLNYALMIQFGDYNKTVNDLVIENDKNANNEVKLTVKYLNY
ncbi:uncharacterized protein DUF4270 [Tenacibaculum adriaticum]|uniref:Uncharacterized protein DUF4270 n=1 Tax=Tenacibaculum adriaticum TaxID=413713 RepID=A0A5S5DRX5_9FLAO|nr:DUF4270 family protein [Tenacibaculum adriaticum]TYP98138.1 uncharacterized protein DUF4270 [Tenacibaculum adriaticum]